MRIGKSFVTGLVFSLLLGNASEAQTGDSLINGTIRTWSHYSARHSAPGVFLHLDKSIYRHSENIQFTGYLLGASDTALLHTLYVGLVRPGTGKLISFCRFAFFSGVGSGAMYLPDSLAAGEYLVTAYTDLLLNGYAQPLFRQAITVLPDQFPPFSVEQKKDSFPLSFKVTTDYMGLASGGSFHYRLMADGKIMDSGEKKIDAFGEVRLSPRTTFADADRIQLSATISRQDLHSSCWIPVVARAAAWRIRFYPESGTLVDDQLCQLGIEIQDEHGRGVQTSGRLLENGQPLTFFRTDENGWGKVLGQFYTGREYTIDFPGDSHPASIRQSFPRVEPRGYTISIGDAIARDSVTAIFHIPELGQKCRLLVYNEHEIAYAATITAGSDLSRLVMDARDWPKGLLTITLFSPEGVPVAERKLFVPAAPIHVEITTDSSSYYFRSQVHLHVHATNEKGEGVHGVFSLASVLSGRLRETGMPDIARYAAIDQHLPRMDFPSAGPYHSLPDQGWDTDSTLNLLLLIRGWTKYYWQQVAADSLFTPPPFSAVDHGLVLQKNKTPKAPVDMIVMGARFVSFKTDQHGAFQIDPSYLLSEKQNQLAISLSGGDQMDEFRILMFNSYDSMNARIAAAWYPSPVAREEKEEGNDMNKGFSALQAKTLQKVIVGPHRGWVTDPNCSDYVCQFGILNCPNHPYGRKPYIGEIVRINMGFGNMREIRYTACTEEGPRYPPYVRLIAPVRLLKQSYELDSAILSAPSPVLTTTLHWSPVVTTDTSGNAELTFYTNDLPGTYINVIQGISDQGFLSGKQSYRVAAAKN